MSAREKCPMSLPRLWVWLGSVKFALQALAQGPVASQFYSFRKVGNICHRQEGAHV